MHTESAKEDRRRRARRVFKTGGLPAVHHLVDVVMQEGVGDVELVHRPIL
jgi:hypothetical protein